MEAETLKALKESIAKWDKNTRVRNLDRAKIGVGNCPLCGLFFDRDCSGCPVFEETEVPACVETPYEDAEFAWTIDDGPSFRAEAIKERDFLISLLPEGETWK